jgi:hypothetical protein
MFLHPNGYCISTPVWCLLPIPVAVENQISYHFIGRERDASDNYRNHIEGRSERFMYAALSKKNTPGLPP